MKLQFKYLPTNRIHLHTALAGPEEAPPVFLLHGFPEAWFGWEAQIKPLVEAGYRIIVPDQRGYNLSDKPEGVENYQMNILVADILGLADTLGYEKFHLAGHDFGALVSWHIAMQAAQRVKRLAIANVPHPTVMSRYIRTHPAQMLKSWYVMFFQLPVLPERFVQLNNWRMFISAMPPDFSEETRNRYRDAWAQPNAMTSMINWYRALLKGRDKPAVSARIQIPTLILWGKQDSYLSYEMAPLSLDFCEQGKLITFEDATHWVLYDQAQAVSQHLVDHLSS